MSTLNRRKTGVNENSPRRLRAKTGLAAASAERIQSPHPTSPPERREKSPEPPRRRPIRPLFMIEAGKPKPVWPLDDDGRPIAPDAKTHFTSQQFAVIYMHWRVADLDSIWNAIFGDIFAKPPSATRRRQDLIAQVRRRLSEVASMTVAISAMLDDLAALEPKRKAGRCNA